MNRFEELVSAHNARKAVERHPYLVREYIPKPRIDRICQAALEEHRLLPQEPMPIRIDRLLELKWGFPESYEDLPDGVLGAAAFTKDGLSKVVLSKEFDEPVGLVAERRGRATLAHEIGHGLLHEPMWNHYFREKSQPTLFDTHCDGQDEFIGEMCRDSVINAVNYSNSHFQWWEYQANLAMGFLLVPTPLLAKALSNHEEVYIKSDPIEGLDEEIFTSLNFAAECLAETFNVSVSLMRCRLNTFEHTGSYGISV